MQKCMKRRYIIFFMLSVFIVITTLMSLYPVEVNKSEPKKKLKDIKIILIQKTGHRKPEIRFNHLKHVEKYNTECIDCHHKLTNKKCSTCHLKKDQGTIVNLKDAFHQQCHDCHRKTSGPKACGRCHNRKD